MRARPQSWGTERFRREPQAKVENSGDLVHKVGLLAVGQLLTLIGLGADVANKQVETKLSLGWERNLEKGRGQP